VRVDIREAPRKEQEASLVQSALRAYLSALKEHPRIERTFQSVVVPIEVTLHQQLAIAVSRVPGRAASWAADCMY